MPYSQAEAENLHQEGLQRFSEARAKLVDLHAKHKAGELSAEALASGNTELSAAMEDAKSLLARAEQLNTIDRGSARLSELGAMDAGEPDTRPEYLRPMGAGEPDTRPEYLRPMGGSDGDVLGAADRFDRQEESLAGLHASIGMMTRYGMTSEQLSRVSRIAGVAPHTFKQPEGRVRLLLNRFLRHKYLKDRGRESEMLTKEAMAFLQGPGPRPEVAAESAGYDGLEQLNFSPYIDRDGGSIVGHEMRNEIISHLRDRRHIRSLARVFPTNAGSVSFPVFKLRVKLKKSRAHKGKIDGSGEPNIRDFLGKTEFTPHGKLETILFPEELIEDMETDLVSMVTEEIALEAFDDEELEFLTGSGQSESVGVLTALAGTTQGIAHTGPSGAGFLPEDLKTLPFQIREVFRVGAIWMVNRVFLQKVVVMRTEDGGAKTGQFLFQPGLRAGEPGTIGGYEVRESEFYPEHINGSGGASQNVGDPMALFGDWRQYWIIDRLGLEIRILDQTDAKQGMIAYRFRKRLDGAPVRLESWVTLDRT